MAAVANVDRDLSELGFENRMSKGALHIVSRLVTEGTDVRYVIRKVCLLSPCVYKVYALPQYLVKVAHSRNVVLARFSNYAAFA